jgi:hypothetical protein
MRDQTNSLEDSKSSHAANVRFKQQLFASIGGGMIFALVGVVTTALLHGAGGILASSLGIVTVAAVGLACVYAAAKYLSKAISMDQESQAEKINEAKMRARGITVEQTLPTQDIKPVQPPFGENVAQDASAQAQTPLQDTTPGNTLSDIAYQNKLVMPMGEKITLH